MLPLKALIAQTPILLMNLDLEQDLLLDQRRVLVLGRRTPDGNVGRVLLNDVLVHSQHGEYPK